MPAVFSTSEVAEMSGFTASQVRAVLDSLNPPVLRIGRNRVATSERLPEILTLLDERFGRRREAQQS